jgi:pyruvate, water dikinase
MGKTADISTGVNPLLWLDRPQDLGHEQVGEQLVSLSQILQSGYSVMSGFIVSDALMQQVWTQISWADKALQDFPYLHLNFSLDQAAQLQFLARTLQSGILALPLPKTWAAIWRAALKSRGGTRILLTPYLWTSQKGIDAALNLGSMLSLQPQLCNSQVESFWASLKSLWAELFRAGHLYVLQQLGLHPEKMHLSVLVQSLPDIQAAGWMQWSPAHLHVQVLQDLEPSVWQGQQWPEFYTYDRLIQRPSWHHDDLWTETKFQFDWLSKAVLQPMLELGSVLETNLETNLTTMPITALWVLLKHASETQLELLGLVPDLPMPMPRRQKRSSLSDGLLGRGIAAAPGRLVAPVVVVDNFEQISPAALRGAILVTRDLAPIHLAWLKEAAGFLCETGGALSHGAIMAREFGCPAVVGVEGIMAELQTGQWVVLEGGLGEVYSRSPASIEPSIKPLGLEAVSHAPRAIQTTAKVMANLSQADLLERIQTLDIDGIGLVRGEWLLLDQLRQPGTIHWLLGSRRTRIKRKLWSDLEQMIYALTPLPIFYRAVDLYAADWNRLSAAPIPPENNPAIGLRGSLRHLFNAHLLDLELEILKEFIEDGFDNLRLILPFVRSPQEVRHCVQKMQELGIRDRLPLWLMAEVPSVLFALEEYKKAGIQGIAIGVNDLTQLLLGIDRDHLAFELVWSEQHATVMVAIVQMVQQATALNLPSIWCGSLNHLSKEWLERLLQAGLTGVSVDMGAVGSAREAISQAEQNLSHRSFATLKPDPKTP